MKLSFSAILVFEVMTLYRHSCCESAFVLESKGKFLEITFIPSPLMNAYIRRQSKKAAMEKAFNQNVQTPEM